MDNIFTTEPTAEEAAQMQVMLDDAIAEMKRMREVIDRDHKDIAASQARTDVVMNEIQEMMKNLRRR